MTGLDESVPRGPGTGAETPPRPVRRSLWIAWLRMVFAACVGAAVGAAYAYFIGCRTGMCPLTSSVWTASLYGGAVGAIARWPARRR